MRFDRARRQPKEELSEKPSVMLTIKTLLLECPEVHRGGLVSYGLLVL